MFAASVFMPAAMTLPAHAQDDNKALPAICAQNQDANAQIIARAESAKDDATRIAIIQEALKKNPENAICIINMLMQLANAQNVNPAEGPENTGGSDVGNTTNGTGGVPGENPSQLNSVSPNSI